LIAAFVQPLLDFCLPCECNFFFPYVSISVPYVYIDLCFELPCGSDCTTAFTYSILFPLGRWMTRHYLLPLIGRLCTKWQNCNHMHPLIMKQHALLSRKNNKSKGILIFPIPIVHGDLNLIFYPVFFTHWHLHLDLIRPHLWAAEWCQVILDGQILR